MAGGSERGVWVFSGGARDPELGAWVFRSGAWGFEPGAWVSFGGTRDSERGTWVYFGGRRDSERGAWLFSGGALGSFSATRGNLSHAGALQRLSQYFRHTPQPAIRSEKRCRPNCPGRRLLQPGPLRSFWQRSRNSPISVHKTKTQKTRKPGGHVGTRPARGDRDTLAGSPAIECHPSKAAHGTY